MNLRTKSSIKIVIGALIIISNLRGLFSSFFYVFWSYDHSPELLGKSTGMFVGGLLVFVAGVWLLIIGIKQRRQALQVSAEAKSVSDKSLITPKENKILGILFIIVGVIFWVKGDGGESYNGYLVGLGWIAIILCIYFFNKKSKTFIK